MKPIVEGMGLDWDTQKKKIGSHHLLSSCKVNSTFQMIGDDQEREHIMLPLNRVPMWLITIQPNKVPDPATRARVVEFQEQVPDVLFNHFFGKAIAAGEHLNAQQTGGIFKAGLGKLKRELLAEIAPQFAALAEELRTIHRPVGVAVVTHRTAKRWLDHYGITKRPRGLVRRVSNALMRQSIRMGYTVSYTAEEEVRSFHEVVANAYFSTGPGRHLLPKAVKGQKEMGLGASPVPFAQTPARTA